MKTFFVDFEKKWGEKSIRVRAKNKNEAKKKGWERFKRRIKQKKDYTVYADEI